MQDCEQAIYTVVTCFACQLGMLPCEGTNTNNKLNTKFYLKEESKVTCAITEVLVIEDAAEEGRNL